MITTFEFGPIEKINLTLEGDAKNHYGTYNDLPESIQSTLQLFSHAIIQISNNIKNSNDGVLWINKLMIANFVNGNYEIYSLNNFDNGMAIMNLIKRGDCYSTDFFSTKQLSLADSIISFAKTDSQQNGRNT